MPGMKPINKDKVDECKTKAKKTLNSSIWLLNWFGEEQNGN